MMKNYLPVINTHFTLFGGHVETVRPGWKWKPEEHPAFELMYVIRGSQRTITETGEMILNTGEFTIIPVETRHTNYAVGNEKMTYFCMHFDLDDPTLKYLLIRSYADRIITSQDAEYQDLKDQVEVVMQLFKSKYDLEDQLDIQIDVLKIIKILVKVLKRDHHLQDYQNDINQFMLCQKIASDLKHRLDYEIYHASDPKSVSISKVVKSHHVSQSYVLKLFNRYYGESPQEYLIDLKLSSAKGLLLQPRVQINEVADKLAYSAPSHFSREFEKHFNITPRQYIQGVSK